MKNHKGGVTERYDIPSAAGAYTSGVPKVEGDQAGVPETTGLTGTPFVLRIGGIFAFPTGSPNTLSGVTRGQKVYIVDATGALVLASATGNRPFGRCERLPGDDGVPAGYCWVRVSKSLPTVTA